MSAESLSLGSPVLLARLRRAREDLALSQNQVAEALGLARTTLVAIEAGDRRLRADELLQLASLYDARLDELLRSNPPPRCLAAQFRTAFGSMPDQTELRGAAAELQRLAEDYLELEHIMGVRRGDRYLAGRDIPDSQGVEVAASLMADEERGRLGLGDGPLPHLREVLENDVGLRIFALRLPSRVAGLFGFDIELGPCVAINANQRYERQRWSLAHEYAHFLTRRDRAEVTVLLSQYRRVPASERYADSFARHFLMPTGGVIRRYQMAAAEVGRPTNALLLQQADWWGVSFQAYVLRLEDVGLVKPGLYDRLNRRGFHVDEGRQLLGLPPRLADSTLLPRRFRLLAVGAYADGRISEERLSRFLRADRLEARAAVAELIAPLDGDVAAP